MAKNQRRCWHVTTNGERAGDILAMGEKLKNNYH